MDAQQDSDRFLEVFLREWDMFNKDGGRAPAGELAPVADGDYDTPIRIGEVRAFATDDQPLVGLVYRDWGDDAWVVIPVSEFSVPATNREVLVGKHVYQLWNSFTAPVSFAQRSWLVDVVPDRDLDDIGEALLHVMIGDPVGESLRECMGFAITSIEDPRLDYERQFVLKIDFSEIWERPSVRDFWRQPRVIDIIRKGAKWLRDNESSLGRLRYAAATDADDVQPFMLLVDDAAADAVKRQYVVCSLETEFRPIYPGHEPYRLVFTPSDELHEQWHIAGNACVRALNRETLAVVGEGSYDSSGREIVVQTIQISDEKDRIEHPGQLLLVMAKEAGHGKD